MSIEDEFWSALKEIAARKETALFELCSQIDKDRADDNLSSAVRLFVLAYYIERVAETWWPSLQHRQICRRRAVSLNNLGVAEFTFVRVPGALKRYGSDIF